MSGNFPQLRFSIAFLIEELRFSIAFLVEVLAFFMVSVSLFAKMLGGCGHLLQPFPPSATAGDGAGGVLGANGEEEDSDEEDVQEDNDEEDIQVFSKCPMREREMAFVCVGGGGGSDEEDVQERYGLKVRFSGFVSGLRVG
ncbi:hypothetical protein T492DRAFT_834089 [Pavlovales sp. CCMP2436]|nr:hypothetical protein T492DRAFT_834089 [Pavlovales sp. CCMP2436]